MIKLRMRVRRDRSRAGVGREVNVGVLLSVDDPVLAPNADAVGRSRWETSWCTYAHTSGRETEC